MCIGPGSIAATSPTHAERLQGDWLARGVRSRGRRSRACPSRARARRGSGLPRKPHHTQPRCNGLACAAAGGAAHEKPLLRDLGRSAPADAGVAPAVRPSTADPDPRHRQHGLLLDHRCESRGIERQHHDRARHPTPDPRDPRTRRAGGGSGPASDRDRGEPPSITSSVRAPMRSFCGSGWRPHTRGRA